MPRRPVDFAVGDLNNDGIDDVAIASRGTNKVSIVLVEPNSTFRQGASLVVGNQIKGIAIGDFNQDGNGDVAISTGTHNIFVVLGKGDGTFLPNSKSTIRRCCSGAGVTVGDFDGNHPGAKFGDDIVFADPINDDVNILFNKNQTGSASFIVPGVRPKAGNKPQYVVAADFNNDGKTDIGALNTAGSGNDVSSVLNNGSGSFTNVGNFFAGKKSRALSYGDYNDDNQLDVVACDQRANTVYLLPGLGGGLFGTGPTLLIPCAMDEASTAPVCTLRQAVIADFDADGNPDLGVLISGPASNSTQNGSQSGGDVNALLVYIGDAAGNFTGPVRVPNLGLTSRLLKLGKFDNRDSLPDLAVISTLDSKLRLLLNTSGSAGGPTNTPTVGGTGGTPTPTPVGGQPTATRTATACRGQGCPCDPVNGDADCNDPFYCAQDDEVCCDTPCDIANVSCGLPGFEGTCKPIDLPDGEECMVGDQCQSGFCVDGFCCNSECSGSNQHCNATPGQCTEGSPRPTPSTTATPTGGGGGNATPTPTRVLKELGTPCISGPECRSTFCPSEDLVCCDSACNGANQRCDLPTQAGHCLPINLPNGDDCVVDQQCISNVCEGGVCVGTASTPTRTATPVAQKTAGDQCTSGSECSSGFCPPDDDVCCDTQCDGENERCDLSPLVGTCLETDLPDGSTCQLEQQCRSRICQGNVCQASSTPSGFTPTRTPNGSRIPTSTRTATPPREPTLILSRGSGCSTGDDSSSGSLALILTLPAFWLITSRTRAAARVRRRPSRRS